MDRPLTEAALAAVELAGSDPRRARLDASAVLAAARRDPEARTVAERALGLAAQELNDLAASRHHLRRAVAIARRARLQAREDEAHRSLALTLAYAGRTAAALRQVDQAEGPRAVATRAMILSHAGRHADAVSAYSGALAGLRGDAVWRARVLNNRGIARAYLGDLTSARGDLERAAALWDEAGMAVYAAATLHNLGWVVGRAGDVPGALDLLDRAADLARAGDVPRADLEGDRCEILLGAGLHDEARTAAGRAVRELERARLAGAARGGAAPARRGAGRVRRHGGGGGAGPRRGARLPPPGTGSLRRAGPVRGGTGERVAGRAPPRDRGPGGSGLARRGG